MDLIRSIEGCVGMGILMVALLIFTYIASEDPKHEFLPARRLASRLPNGVWFLLTLGATLAFVGSIALAALVNVHYGFLTWPTLILAFFGQFVLLYHCTSDRGQPV